MTTRYGVVANSAAWAGLAIVTAQVSVNLGAAAAKSVFPVVGPEGIAGLRAGVSAALLLLVVRPWRARVARQQIGWLALYGLALGGMSLLIYWSFERIPIGIAVAIEICGPMAVVLATSRSLRDLLWLALSIGGLALLVPWPGSETRLDPAGLALALGAGACWALYILAGKRVAQTDGKVAVAIGMTIAAVLTLPIAITTAGPQLLAASVLAWGFAIAILSSMIPFLLEMRAFGRLSSRTFGVVTSSAPAIAAMVGFLVLGERLTPLQGCAVAMMVAASMGGALTSGRPRRLPRLDDAAVPVGLRDPGH